MIILDKTREKKKLLESITNIIALAEISQISNLFDITQKYI